MGKEAVPTLSRRDYQAFIALLVEARKQAGVSQTDLVSRTNMGQSSISAIENCTKRMDVAEFLDYVRVIGFEAGPLIDEFVKRYPKPESVPREKHPRPPKPKVSKPD